MVNATTKQVILRLEGLARGQVKPSGRYQSMCLYLYNVLKVRCHDHIWREWEHYSGDRQYPVPNPNKDSGISESYGAWLGFYHGELWEGAYGDLRRDLCRYVINGLESGFLILVNEEICLREANPDYSELD